MRIFTFGELDTKVRVDLDLQDTVLIPTSEMIGYCNEAVDIAEADIHSLNCEDDYFLTFKDVAFVSGTSVYKLSTTVPNIYGTKIRSFMYSNGTVIYPIKRIRRLDKFQKISDILQWGAADDYQYIITNDLSDLSVTSDPVISSSADEPTLNIRIYPSPRESGTYGKLWYIRNAVRVPTTSYTSFKLDIPEFTSFILAFMKYRSCLKAGDPRMQIYKGEMEEQRALMKATLTPMIPDDDDKVQQDLQIYKEMT